MGVTPDEFFTNDGAIELFCELHQTGSRFTDLNNELPISHTTLSSRLGEAQELELIEKQLMERDGNNVTVYAPTNKGARLILELRRTGVMETYQLLKEIRSRFEERSDNVREWVYENPMEFTTDSDKHLRELDNALAWSDDPYADDDS